MARQRELLTTSSSTPRRRIVRQNIKIILAIVVVVEGEDVARVRSLVVVVGSCATASLLAVWHRMLTSRKSKIKIKRRMVTY